MAGLEKPLNKSLQHKLSFCLSLAILAIALVAGLFSFVSAFNDARELQDDTLRQVSALFDSQHLPLNHPAGDGGTKDRDEDARVIVQHLTDANKTPGKTDSDTALALPTALSDGLQTLNIGGEPFRVLVRTTSGGERIAVSQETGLRDEIARDSALRTLMPFAILVPVLLLIVADLVRRMFRPIASLSEEVDRRGEQDLHPVEESNLPLEVRPFVVAINRLLARVKESMESQRRFIADAAHELRSPLTAMSLQAERLADADMSDPARERLLTLRKGIERNRNLVDQLLTLATARAALNRPKSAVSVQRIYRQVLEDVMPMADAKRIDIGVEGGNDAEVWVNELDLVAVVGNLVNNAIQFTPEGGKIDLSIATEGRCAVLTIRDSGPGIKASERQRVFDPFYRTLGSDQVGSGLGLSIVKATAERIGAEIRLDFTDELNSSGLSVRVFVPTRG